jgi:hypothetical protein
MALPPLPPRTCARDSRPGVWPALAVLALAGALSVAAGLVAALPAAHADSTPALAVTVKSGTTSQTTYTVAASGFPAQTGFTETLGDGSGIAPATGTSDAKGSFTLYWTLDAITKYCGTITAQAGSGQARASFWVALTTDSESGTACQGSTGAGAGGGSGTPTAAAATATAQANATAAAAATPAATQAPTSQPTSAPDASAGSGGTSGGLHALLGRIPWVPVGGAVTVLLVLIIIIGVAAGRGGKPPTGGQREPRRGAPAPGYDPRRRAPGAGYDPQWGGPTGTRMRSPARREPSERNPDPYNGSARRGNEQAAQWRDGAAGTKHRVPGAGRADPRWRILDPEDRGPRSPAPDPRWSRSQPGARQPRDGGSGGQRAVRRDDEWGQWRR